MPPDKDYYRETYGVDWEKKWNEKYAKRAVKQRDAGKVKHEEEKRIFATEVLNLRSQGLTLYQIEKHFGGKVSRPVIRQILQEHNVKFRTWKVSNRE